MFLLLCVKVAKLYQIINFIKKNMLLELFFIKKKIYLYELNSYEIKSKVLYELYIFINETKNFYIKLID